MQRSLIAAFVKVIFLVLLGFPVSQSFGQPVENDSLSLNDLIRQVINTHPSVKKSVEEIRMSDAKIANAKADYLPSVGLSSSYSRIGPVSSISIPDMGTFSFVPKDNYSASIAANQLVSNFGRTEKLVDLELETKKIATQTLEQVKQRLSQQTIQSYFTLLYLQQAIKIKEEQLRTLNEHLLFVTKKQATGSATQYEILTTEVRISTIENQKTDLSTAQTVAMAQLNALLGNDQKKPAVVKTDLALPFNELPGDSMIARSLRNRDEMKMAQIKSKLAAIRYAVAGTQMNPMVNAFVSGGVKNGYTPYLLDPKANFVAGLGLNIPIFDGKRMKYTQMQAKSAQVMNDDETEITRRAIVGEVIEQQANVMAAKRKVDQSKLLVDQATKAYTMAKVKFDAGVITNVELLDGSTSLSESKLMLTKSQIDYIVSLYRLKVSVGDRLYE